MVAGGHAQEFGLSWQMKFDIFRGGLSVSMSLFLLNLFFIYLRFVCKTFEILYLSQQKCEFLRRPAESPPIVCVRALVLPAWISKVSTLAHFVVLDFSSAGDHHSRVENGET